MIVFLLEFLGIRLVLVSVPSFCRLNILPSIAFTFTICSRNMDLLHECEENDFDAILAEMEKEMSMGDIMKELGYGCTVDASQCKEILSLFVPLNEITISKILGTITCSHTGLEDSQNTFSTFGMALGCNTSSDLPLLNSWNIDVLIDTIKQLVSFT